MCFSESGTASSEGGSEEGNEQKEGKEWSWRQASHHKCVEENLGFTLALSLCQTEAGGLSYSGKKKTKFRKLGHTL